MIHFFGNIENTVFAVQTHGNISKENSKKLEWLFGNQPKIQQSVLNTTDFFIGPRAAMVTPWSTNAVEITQNMGVERIIRIEEFHNSSVEKGTFDPMLSQKFKELDQDIFDIHVQPEPILNIENIGEYNKKEGLALNAEEVEYLENLSKKLNRKLTDSEVFGFSQVNSEHCRHKIFNGVFEIDGKEMPSSLFKLIKKTSAENPNGIVSAYKDNVAFVKGPTVKQWAPKNGDKPDWYEEKDFESVISIKAETHNFPTTVEPFNGAATGSGGEIRDRLAGGKGSLPLAGTAVYMTSYSRLDTSAPLSDQNSAPLSDRSPSGAEVKPWEKAMKERDWLYQTPLDILIKASNGASDFGNKFGQPLIAGSVFTFEHEEEARRLGYDKVIMLAGGIGYGKASQAIKGKPQEGDKIVVLGGDNYRIGMGGAAVSSADTGEFHSGIELNAIQRSNPEMQKRAANAIRAMVESDENPIVSIHDHGAGGHLNCLSELVEDTGGRIELDKLPIGDPTLSAKEIMGNESQERMGLIIGEADMQKLKKVADRERAPMYEVGEVTGDQRFCFENKKGEKPMDFALEDMFGSSPKTIMKDKTINRNYKNPDYEITKIKEYVAQVLQLEAVACKDWLTNKVDRCVTGRVAKQQTAGPLQLPLNNCGVMALDYHGNEGVATSIGHSPLTALIDPAAGSRNAITEALTNIVWAPMKDGLKSISLSANWMWPCNNEGEDARLYEAVKAVSEFSIDLGINVPTGKDSLSMKQKYKDGEVISPGTVIISAAGNCNDIKKVVEPVLQRNGGSIYYINISQDDFKLGGSSFGQILNAIGNEAPTVKSAEYVKTVFNTLQELIYEGKILAGHDVASGGLITTLLEMCFADVNLGANLDISPLGENDLVKLLFAENASVVIQASEDALVEKMLSSKKIDFKKIGTVSESNSLSIKNNNKELIIDIPEMRDVWYKTSYLLDRNQSGAKLAKERFNNYKNQPLKFEFPKNFNGKLKSSPGPSKGGERIKAAVIREKGSNSEREMAYMMHLAGFDVKDVHMTDLIEGREDLEDIKLLVAVGGFSNSDVLGSAKGWAGSFLYNEKANSALKNFFAKVDTLSLGVCNGCQLFVELGLLNPEDEEKPKMLHNDTGKFECVFTSVKIQENNSVMLSSFAGSTLGIWSAHGEGKFSFPNKETHYNIVAKYGYDALPANPNGSDFNTAMMTDKTGRHLVMMPHLERSTFPWNWAYYPKDRKNDEVSPWVKAFVNAKKWLENK
ncbi:phosphoribosylformylglycinamidine synthase [Aequorivita lipolytica]|uniref:Phosphoribosylformylglycinamidine synthase n=1 Tax=Aequorivita lipolytica TaxID=153267 RepID=A0A5C6YMG7_9FLAO|nr:phosphoribosylformylglycinamidine synthase [Aequorivita lipolytica]TXD68536.1 phosphoribosylformylglycinamidine synthase [Aequorivita lipolytica]SRX53316.1 Phosphoribosylformylglycinamidine synthase [Aequorivita lipolytica]